MSLLTCLKVAVGWMLNQKALAGRGGDHTGNSEQGHMKGSEESECYKYLVFNCSTLISSLSLIYER